MKQLFRIANEPAVKAIQPVLLLRIGQRHLSYAIADLVSKKVIELASYTAVTIDDTVLADWMNTTPALSQNFFEIAVSFDFPQSMLIPSKEYRHDESSSILKSTYGLNGASVIINEAIPEWQLYNIYAVPNDVFDWVSKKFPAAKYKNGYTVDIKSAKPVGAEGDLLIDFRTDEFSVVLAKQGHILLTQTFDYSTPEDVIFSLLNIVHQFSLTQQEVQLHLSGFIDKQSSLFKELYQYFINISFRDTDWDFPESENPSHFFTSLNDLGLCVS